MPRFLEPDQKFPVVLDCDMEKPIETRPTFYVKSQSMRGQKQIADVLDRSFSDPNLTTEILYQEVIDQLQRVVVGWSNMRLIGEDGEAKDIPFSKDSFIDILDYMEARELLRMVFYNMHVTQEEKKS
jgi:hypothetical protein